MPLFHFNIYDRVPHLDVHGVTLESPQAAARHAVLLVSNLLRGQSENPGFEGLWLEVTDERNLVLFRFDCILTRSALGAFQTSP